MYTSTHKMENNFSESVMRIVKSCVYFERVAEDLNLRKRD